MSHVTRLWYFSSSVNSFFKRSYPMELDVWFLVGPLLEFHTLCVQTAKALAQMHLSKIYFIRWRYNLSFTIARNKSFRNPRKLFLHSFNTCHDDTSRRAFCFLFPWWRQWSYFTRRPRQFPSKHILMFRNWGNNFLFEVRSGLWMFDVVMGQVVMLSVHVIRYISSSSLACCVQFPRCSSTKQQTSLNLSHVTSKPVFSGLRPG